MAPQALGEEVPDRARIVEMASRLDAETLQLYYQIAVQSRQDLPLAPDEYAGFTMALMRMLAFRPETAEGGRTGGAAKTAPTAIKPAAAKAAAAPARSGAACAFDGDWPALARGLAVNGLVKQLALQSELKHFDGELIELRLPVERKALTESAQQLKEALRAHFGRAYALKIELGAVSGKTAAEQDAGEKRARQQQAVAAVQGDDFVKELVEGFDATIVESSIKPAQSS
jgi:DNA polymerase-3 subunit gamma/tau